MKTRVFAVCVVVFLFCGITHAGLSDGLVAYYPFNGNTNIAGLTDYTNSLGVTFKLIPAGTFMMGSPTSELFRGNNEGPQHQVTISKSFYMQTTEVTQGQWKAVMGNNPSYFSSCGDNCPVEQLSWNDCQDFIAKMNQRGEGIYSLPTEAQWEYAARAGSVTAFANGGNTEVSCGYDPNLVVMGWYCYNSNDITHLVAQKNANNWGLYDMHGNIWEWCQDWYGDYPSGSVIDPAGPSSGSDRILRGGGFCYNASGCRSADRDPRGPALRDRSFGFRLAFSLDQVCPDVAVKPNIFSAGTPAKAAEVNANFDVLYNLINTQNCQIKSLKAVVCQDHPAADICK